jgi:hypothetical protein
LEVESCNFSQAEEEKTGCKAEKIQKRTTLYSHFKRQLRTILSENNFVNLLSLQLVLSFSAQEKTT